MAVTKTPTFTGNVSFIASGGVVAGVQIQMNVQLGNDGIPANLRYASAVDIWASLTAPQRTTAQNFYDRCVQLAATVDPPVP